MSEDGLIGREGDLPWRLPADLRRFRRLTMGGAIIMGRKTWESLPVVLDGRLNIVVTRNESYEADGAIVVHSIDAAMEAASDVDDVYVIGGATLYEAAIDLCDRLYVTLVFDGPEGPFEGDVRLPEDVLEGWKAVSVEDHEPDERNVYRYSFRLYERQAVKELNS